ncbi:hypothetical protein NITGR_360055 [Nitrospina gracilis 3/211]|uniref:Uncharacterized protein n=1 Tax=Nitrospina gracilis (strain 3/211) TaxID=1266370 RepID=M1YZ22_NITG3|nr:hypothetical protein NITGR_360055 [Nitrospina gracilis 3/211]
MVLRFCGQSPPAKAAFATNMVNTATTNAISDFFIEMILSEGNLTGIQMNNKTANKLPGKICYSTNAWRFSGHSEHWQK